MELREYWQIVWRRRSLIVPLICVTFIASAIFNLVLPPTFKSETTLYVQAVLPPPTPNPYFSEEYYRTVQSEYLTDDLGVLVKNRAFAEKAVRQIESRYGQVVDVMDVMDAVAQTRKLHRTLKITVATGSEALTERVTQAIADVASRDAAGMLVIDGRDLIRVSVIDPPRDPKAPGMMRRLLEVLLHTAVALVVGIGIAFLLHALDDRIRNEGDAAQTIGLPVLGIIPSVTPEHVRAPTPANFWRKIGGKVTRRPRPAMGASPAGRSLGNSRPVVG